MKKLILITAALITIIYLSMVNMDKISSYYNVKTENSSSLKKVTLAQFGKEKFLLYLPLYIAMEEGYFKEEGLDLEIVFAGNDDQVFAAVAGGSVDFGCGDPVFAAIAQEKGFNAKIIALMVTNLGLSGYTNNKNMHEIRSIKDLNGLRIGSFPKPSTTYTMLNGLKLKNTKTLKDLKIIEAGFGSQLALLESNKADIAIDLEPMVSKLEEKGYNIVFDLNNYIEKQAVTGFMVNNKTIEENPQIVQGLVNGLAKALKVLHEDKNNKTGIKVAKKLFPTLSDNVLNNAINRMMDKEVFPKNPYTVEEYWQRTLKTRLDSGELKQKQKTIKSVDNSFAIKSIESLN